MLVLAIAVIVLIVILTAIALSIQAAVKNTAYPPFQNTCPDYWTAITINGNSAVCKVNSKNMGNTNGGTIFSSTPTTDTNMTYTPGWDVHAQTIDFGNAGWTTAFGGATPACSQKKWAAINGIEWDGITNSNMAC